jgi:hypothetical protein
LWSPPLTGGHHANEKNEIRSAQSRDITSLNLGVVNWSQTYSSNDKQRSFKPFESRPLSVHIYDMPGFLWRGPVQIVHIGYIRVKIMKWEVSLEVGSMAYIIIHTLKMQISMCFGIWNEWYLLRRNNTRFYVNLGVGSMPEIALSRVTYKRKFQQVWGPKDLDLSYWQHLWGFRSGAWELNPNCAVANIV